MVSQIEKEFEEFETQLIWPQVYQKIKNEASLKSISEKLSVGEARKPENRSKNRYRDVSPYDHSRVILQQGESDYINASLIQVPESKRTYILSQGPLEHTAAQFWQMVWEQNSKAIVMLNRVIEKGTLKCHQYWPLGEEDEDDEMYFEETGIKVTLQDELETQHYTIRTFEVENAQTEQVREVYHFHYTTWPDFGIPSSPVSFLLYLQAVREKGVLEEDVGPAIIHCSAGIGRSGTFCLVDSALVLVEKSGTMEGIDIQSLLISMRSYRMGLIQTFDQLKFSYMAIIAGGRQLVANAGAQEVNSVLDEYMEDKSCDENAPQPPPRVESLSPSKRRGQPPPPPPRSFPVEDSSGEAQGEADEPINKQQRLEDDSPSHIPQKPPRAHVFTDSDSEKHSDTDSTKLSDDANDSDQSKGVSLSSIDTGMSTTDQGRSSNDSKLATKSIRDPFENNNPVVDEAGAESSSVQNDRLSLRDNQIQQGDDVASGVNQAQEVGQGPSEQAAGAQQQDSTTSEDTSETQLRQRRKDEREKRKEKTQEMINTMREKQQNSETWKKQQTYLRPAMIGLSLLIGTFLIYKYYTW